MARKTVLSLALVWALTGSVGAFAKDPAPPLPPAPPPTAPTAAPDPNTIHTLKLFKDAGADINYLGRMYGLDGWLITKDTSVEVVYTTPDGQASVVGLLYGPEGNLVTTSQLEDAKAKGLVLANTSAGKTAPEAAPTPPVARQGETQGSAGERLWKDVEASAYITVGAKTAPVLYIFVDPRCHYCQAYWQSLGTEALPQNAVQVRLIPVGILGPDSIRLGEEILSAPDKAAAWTANEAGNYSALPTEAAPDAAAKLDANRQLMLKYGFTGTPYSVYRGKDGKVKIVYGVPSNLAQVIADLGPS